MQIRLEDAEVVRAHVAYGLYLAVIITVEKVKKRQIHKNLRPAHPLAIPGMARAAEYRVSPILGHPDRIQSSIRSHGR